MTCRRPTGSQFHALAMIFGPFPVADQRKPRARAWRSEVYRTVARHFVVGELEVLLQVASADRDQIVKAAEGEACHRYLADRRGDHRRGEAAPVRCTDHCREVPARGMPRYRHPLGIAVE